MAMANQGQGAMKKRQQISGSKRTMFFWVAGMSAVIGCALVVAWFLWQQIVFKNKVISEKNQTVSTLKQNNEAAPELRSNIRALESNTGLNSVKANNDDKALQSILDALPSEANSLALGSSITDRLAGSVNGVSIDSLTVAPSSDEAQSVDEISNDETSDNTNAITFEMVVSSSDVNALKTMLENFEKSIRVINVNSMKLDTGEDQFRLTLSAEAYYQPAKDISLKSKVVKP